MLEIKNYTWDYVNSNSWLIMENDQGLLIDAVYNEELFDDILEMKRTDIVITHSHFDHISGLNKIRELIGDCTVVSTKNCSNNIGSRYRNLSSGAGVLKLFSYKIRDDIIFDEFECDPSDVTFDGCLTLFWRSHKVELFSVYGHSNDGLIAVIDGKFLFSGDTLLHTPTFTRFPGGNNKLFWEKDFPLIDEMKDNIEDVFPGHGECGKIEKMLKVNFCSV